MNEPAAVRKVQQALAYLAALHSGDPDRERQAARQAARWRERSPVNENAWQEANQRWHLVHGYAPQLREQLLPRHDHAAALSRRALLQRAGRAGGALAFAGVAGWLGALWRREVFEQQLLTAHGEPPRAVTLADGSRLLLAAESNVRVRYGLGERTVMLLHGKVFFDVAHERLRSFVVRTRAGQVEVMGTAFSVVDRGADVRVEVARGQVRVRDNRGAERLLEAGQAVSIDRAGDLGPIEPGTARGAGFDNWQRGWWSFTNTPLSEVVGELNACLADAVELDAAAAGLRLTGSFRIDQPQQVLGALPRVLPVRLVEKGDGRRLVLKQSPLTP